MTQTIKPMHIKFYAKDLNIAYEKGRADTLKEVEKIIDDCPDMPLPQYCSKKMLKEKIKKEQSK